MREWAFRIALACYVTAALVLGLAIVADMVNRAFSS